VVLHAMLRHLRPGRIVDVGSGYSSALVIDTVDRWLPDAEVTFVEPHPQLVEGLLRPDDEARVTIHRQPVHDVDTAVFEALGPGDVLFVDSTWPSPSAGSRTSCGSATGPSSRACRGWRGTRGPTSGCSGSPDPGPPRRGCVA
jgi:hypothetical protein